MGIRFTVRSAPPAPAQPTLVVADTFTAADGTPIQGRTTESGGKTWTLDSISPTVTPVVQGGFMTAPTGTGVRPALIDVGATDYTLEFTLAGTPTGSVREAVGVIRSDGAGNAWYIGAGWGGIGTWAVYRTVAGSPQSTGSVRVAGTPATGDKVKAVVQGGTVTVSVNGTQIGSPVDISVSYTSNTKVGAAVRGERADGVDNFKVTVY